MLRGEGKGAWNGNACNAGYVMGKASITES